MAQFPANSATSASFARLTFITGNVIFLRLKNGAVLHSPQFLDLGLPPALTFEVIARVGDGRLARA